MNKFAWMTYLDKKDYLPGLQGLYYSLQRVNTKYDLIIIYAGEIEEKDILNYIEEKQVILEKIPEYIVSPGIKKDMISEGLFEGTTAISNMIYFSWQNSNIIGPFYGFKFEQYEEIMYIHCDMIVLENIDDYFYNLDKQGIYVAGLFKDEKHHEEREYVHSSHYMFFKPNMHIFNLILTNINNILSNRYIANIDCFINIFFIDKNYLSVYKLPNDDWLDERIFHSTGLLKYWTLFPNINIKKIIQNKKLKEITTAIEKEAFVLCREPIEQQIPLSIWKDNIKLINEFKNKCPDNFKGKIKWKQ